MPLPAVAEWFMVLPATVFLAAATLRDLQSHQHEPARTNWLILRWADSHVSRAHATTMFLGLPSLVVAAGLAALWQEWRCHPSLRHEAAAALALLRRHPVICLLAAATLLEGLTRTAVADIITA